MPLMKNPAHALRQARDLQRQLQSFDSYVFSEVHGADEDLNTGLMNGIYKAQQACMVLLNKLVDINANKDQESFERISEMLGVLHKESELLTA